MEIFEIIVGSSSILSFLVSLFVANKVIKISNNIKVKNKGSMAKIKGNGNISSGRDSIIGKK